MKMVLLKQRSNREGHEKYNDLFLCWTYKDKKYKVRVRPVFSSDCEKLFATAIKVETGENLEKYM